METMYGLRVAGCTQDFFSPTNCETIYHTNLSIAPKPSRNEPLTSLTANLLAPSFNWNNTMCVVYGMTGP